MDSDVVEQPNQQDSEPSPWYVQTSHDFALVQERLERFAQRADAAIERQVRVAHLARNEISKLTYMRQVLDPDRLRRLPDYYDLTLTGTQIGGTISVYRQGLDRVLESYETIDDQEIDLFASVLTDVLPLESTSGSAVTSVALLAIEIEKIDPIHQQIGQPAITLQGLSHDEIRDRLSELLAPFDRKFQAMLQGSEDALHTPSADHLSQATHSMRDLLQQLIENLAPSEALKSQSWFSPVNGAPNGVSRRARLRYILYGSGTDYDEITLALYDRIADTAKCHMDLMQKWAHEHNSALTTESATLAIDQARYDLIGILEAVNRNNAARANRDLARPDTDERRRSPD